MPSTHIWHHKNHSASTTISSKTKAYWSKYKHPLFPLNTRLCWLWQIITIRCWNGILSITPRSQYQGPAAKLTIRTVLIAWSIKVVSQWWLIKVSKSTKLMIRIQSEKRGVTLSMWSLWPILITNWQPHRNGLSNSWQTSIMLNYPRQLLNWNKSIRSKYLSIRSTKLSKNCHSSISRV